MWGLWKTNHNLWYTGSVFWRIQLLRRVSILEDEVLTLKRQLESVKLEWSDTLSKVGRLTGRIAKERSRMLEAQTEEPSNGTAGSEGSIPTAGFSPQQKAVQQMVLRRRGGHL